MTILRAWWARRDCHNPIKSIYLAWLTRRNSPTGLCGVAGRMANLFRRKPKPVIVKPAWVGIPLTAHVYQHGPKLKPRSWSQRGYEISERGKPSVSVHIDRLTDEQRVQIDSLSLPHRAGVAI